MKNKKIADVIDTVVQVINKDRPDEKMISMSDSTQLLGSESVLDSLDLFMFIMELEAQLILVSEDVDVMGIIETSINEKNDITLLNLVTQIQQL
jgi:hypothetical protein